MMASSFSFLTSVSLPIFGARCLTTSILRWIFFFFKSHECVISSAVSLGKERVPHFEALYISELKAEARQFTLEFPNILKLRHGGYLMGVTQGRGFGENGDSLDALKLQCL